jgi:hypothetical protein
VWALQWAVRFAGRPIAVALEQSRSPASILGPALLAATTRSGATVENVRIPALKSAGAILKSLMAEA